MAKHSRHIPKVVKNHLISESGNKCANPGCSNTRLEIHHIKQWAVYKSHNAAHMIAVCPSCHDACHNGELKITDEILYAWKTTKRNNSPRYSHIYVEPGEKSRLQLGTIGVEQTRERRTIVFKFSEKNNLEFSVKDNWLRVSTTITDFNEQPILKVTDNQLTLKRDDEVKITQRPGKFTITVPAKKFYLPAYALLMMRREEPEYGENDQITALDLEVIKPGHIQVQGFWTQNNRVVVITKKSLNFCSTDLQRPLSLVGSDDTTFLYDGPINSAMFGV